MPNLFKDQQLMRDVELFGKVREESASQLEQWGVQTRTSFEWLTYTAEELGELAEAISEFEYRGGSASKVIFEAIQTATLSLKIAEMFMEDQERRAKNGN